MSIVAYWNFAIEKIKVQNRCIFKEIRCINGKNNVYTKDKNKTRTLTNPVASRMAKPLWRLCHSSSNSG